MPSLWWKWKCPEPVRAFAVTHGSGSPPSRDAAAFVQNLAALQCASWCLTRRSKAETDCCHLQAGKCASIRVEQQCCSSLSSRKHQASTWVQPESIWGAVAKRQCLCVFLHAQDIGRVQGSAQAQKREPLCCSCPTPFSTLWVYPPYL